MKTKKMIMAALAAGLGPCSGPLDPRPVGRLPLLRPLGRAITPNGDNVNDRLFICFDNFSDSGVSGKIYTLLGAEVASMGGKSSSWGTACTGGTLPQLLSWDGRTSEGTVRGGMYVYRIEAEGKTYAGTLLVVR